MPQWKYCRFSTKQKQLINEFIMGTNKKYIDKYNTQFIMPYHFIKPHPDNFITLDISINELFYNRNVVTVLI